jgi:hypothetical protein
MRLNLTRPILKPCAINGITSAPCSKKEQHTNQLLSITNAHQIYCYVHQIYCLLSGVTSAPCSKHTVRGTARVTAKPHAHACRSETLGYTMRETGRESSTCVARCLYQHKPYKPRRCLFTLTGGSASAGKQAFKEACNRVAVQHSSHRQLQHACCEPAQVCAAQSCVCCPHLDGCPACLEQAHDASAGHRALDHLQRQGKKKRGSTVCSASCATTNTAARDQPANKSASQPVRQSANKSLSHSLNLPVSASVTLAVTQSEIRLDACSASQAVG